MKFGLRTLPYPLRWFMPSALIAHGFCSGLLRPASGTWGSLLAVILLIGLNHTLTTPLRIMAAFGIYWIGFVSIKILIQKCKKSKSEPFGDASWIVIDEWVGMMIAAILCSSVYDYGVAFLLFRLFDVLKPYPISWIDNSVHGAHGVMLDDVLAGMMAVIVFGLLSYFGILPI